MLPLSPKVVAHAILSGSNLNPQNRARKLMAKLMKTGDRRLHSGSADRPNLPWDYDNRHVRRMRNDGQQK